MEFRAKQSAKDLQRNIEFLYRRRYNLSIHDPRYLDATREDMMIDYYANLYADDPSAMSEVEDPDFDVEAEIARLNERGDMEDV